ncbi:hypothetical protein ACFWBF_25435, partial [Streptomyces sp. NPDC060028]|uniref:hypothetical protein n=1 Tax=Streptomyces sp. NPDC060028 TaxID=3347041 RepID=UPI00368F0061
LLVQPPRPVAPMSRSRPARAVAPDHRTESGTPPQAANGNSPDGWEAMMSTWDFWCNHRVPWRP